VPVTAINPPQCEAFCFRREVQVMIHVTEAEEKSICNAFHPWALPTVMYKGNSGYLLLVHILDRMYKMVVRRAWCVFMESVNRQS